MVASVEETRLIWFVLRVLEARRRLAPMSSEKVPWCASVNGSRGTEGLAGGIRLQPCFSDKHHQNQVG